LQTTTDYVQETGRGGRDGRQTRCVLFFRDQDLERAKQVVRFHQLKEVQEEKEIVSSRLEEVRKYAMEGKTCRRLMLASSTVVEYDKNQVCRVHLCDNCTQAKEKDHEEDISVTSVIHKIVENVSDEDINNFSKFCSSVASLLDSSTRTEQLILCSLFHPWKETQKSLLNLLHRFLTREIKEYNQIYWRNKFKDLGILFFLRNFDNHYRSMLALESNKKLITGFDSVHSFKKTPVSTNSSSDMNIYPYIVRFELKRLGLEHQESRQFWKKLEEHHRRGIVAALDFIYSEVSYQTSTVRTQIQQGKSLFFRCKLLTDPDCLASSRKETLHWLRFLSIDQPQLAKGRRIYRHFGSNRFLEISVSADIQGKVVKQWFKNSFAFCGREFRFLWCKKDKSPQAYVFFAEKGCDISKENELTVQELVDRYIPKTINPDLTISKLSKRMKLSFSGTTKGPLINESSIQLLPDFQLDGFAEIDGAGLISLPALNLIWKSYQESAEEKELGRASPTGFQGRIAGFKGTWCIDSSLRGIVVQCRSSMKKYNTPHSCIVGTCREQQDPLFDTIEICSWNEELRAALNTRIVQILEHWSSTISKEGELFEFMKKCMKEELDFLDSLRQSGSSQLLSLLKSRNRNMLRQGISNELDYERKDTRQLFKMAVANIGSNDPEFCRRRARLIEKICASIRDKAHYPIQNTCTLRIIPDHTFLLREGEAFLALESVETDEIIAIRSPSYFKGDLRRLKVVTLQELLGRQSGVEMPSMSQPLVDTPLRREFSEKIGFFASNKNCLVLSNLGCRSEADRMSGGDYGKITLSI
jgi:hypothetical protein